MSNSEPVSLQQYQAEHAHIEHAHGDIKLNPNENLYDALRRKGLLTQPSAPTGIGLNLVPRGTIGLCLNNGQAEFLAPGRHTLWSPMRKFVGAVPITQALIELVDVQIVTIPQGEFGLSRKNGETILLDPGRYILQAPHRFEKTTAANAQYIELGTYRRITVPTGHVAIAFDQGKQIIIRPEDTAKGPFETTSPTFSFNPTTGFQTVQLQVRELDELMVNTRDGITITAKGLICYRIADPHLAFMTVQDIHGSIKRAAEAVLTSIFLNASIDQIAPSVPSNTKGKSPQLEMVDNMSEDHADFSRHVQDCFLHNFTQRVAQWGIELKNLNIEKLEFDQRVQDLLRKRAQARLETATNIANMFAQTDVAVQESERDRKQKQIKADAEAAAIRTKAEADFFATQRQAEASAFAAQRQAEANALVIKATADAEFYAAQRRAEAAKLLNDIPLANTLEAKRLDVEIVRAAGNRTTFLPLGVNVNEVGLRDGKDPVVWAGKRAQV